MMLTKLVRAREWASQLRKLTPEIQEDVDQFLDATSQCQQLQAGFLRDAQRMFHGGGSLSRFLAQRQAEDGFETQKPKLANREYLVGGRTALLSCGWPVRFFFHRLTTNSSRHRLMARKTRNPRWNCLISTPLKSNLRPCLNRKPYIDQ